MHSRMIPRQQVSLFQGGNRGAELAAKADLMLARYPDYIREQVTELLRVLAAKPDRWKKGFDRSLSVV